MTVSSTNSKHIYSGNGVTTYWPYTFTIINTTDIKVYLTNADAEVSEITTGFTVDELNSRVVYPAVGSGLDVLPTGWKITLVREMDLTQSLDLTRQGPLDSESLEEAYDKLTLIAQQHDEQISRCIIWNIDSTPSTVDTTAYLEQIQAERTAAQTAATAAETAQGLSEDARDASIVAQGLSEDARDAAGIAQVAAELAETNAELAQAAAESARDLALGYRDSASSYATIATNQASAASGFATTATTQAGIATTQAGDALTYKNAAEAAQTAAEAAQGFAETAQGLAEDAQTAAETAQGLAESARDTAVTNAGTATTQAGLATSAKADALLAQAAAEAARDLASGYKDTATTQAGLATAAKDDAVIAKNAAETAQGLAESARDAAQGYASDAEDAKDAAEAAAALLAAGTFDNELTIKQITTPANPSAGYNKLYVKSDNKFYTKDSTGNELAVGSGSGGGGVNYIGNGDYETNTDGWYIYNDGTSATPVDGDGGDISANYLTIARTTTAGQILRGNASGKLSKTANNAQGWGLAYPFTIALADKCKPLQLRTSYLTLDTNFSYANEDLRAWVYDVDNSQLIPVTPYQFDGSGAFLGEFQATTSLNYRLIFHNATVNATAWDICLDDVTVGPTHFVYGSLQDRQYDLTVTGTNWTTTRAVGLVTKTKDGTWRLSFNIYGTLSSPAGSLALAIAGVTFKTGPSQAVAITVPGSGPYNASYAQSASSNIILQLSSGSSSSWGASGDIELDSKPTWAVDSYPVQYGDWLSSRAIELFVYVTDTSIDSPNKIIPVSSTIFDTYQMKYGNYIKVAVTGYYKIGGALYAYNNAGGGYVETYMGRISNGSTTHTLLTRHLYAYEMSTYKSINSLIYAIAGDLLYLNATASTSTSNIYGGSYITISKDPGSAFITASEKASEGFGGANAGVADGNIIIFPTSFFSLQGLYNVSTGEIIPRYSGMFRIDGFIWAGAGSAIYTYKNGVVNKLLAQLDSNGYGSVSQVIQCEAGKPITIRPYGTSSGTIDSRTNLYFTSI